MTATWETPSTKSGFYILPTNLVVTLKSCSLFLLVKTTNHKTEYGTQRSEKTNIKNLKLVVMVHVWSLHYAVLQRTAKKCKRIRSYEVTRRLLLIKSVFRRHHSVVLFCRAGNIILRW